MSGNGGAIAEINGWLKKPFNPQMDAAGWALFVSLIVLVTLFWHGVLSKLLSAVE